MRGGARRHARLHRLHADRDRPRALRARGAQRRVARGGRAADVLDRSRRLHAQHESRAGRDDAAGRLRAPHGRGLHGFAGGCAALVSGPDGASPWAPPRWRRLRRPAGPRGPGGDYHPSRRMKVLLTNDDGIEAEGLQALRRALRELPDVALAVIAPDGNRSATARSITTRRPLWVEEVDFGDGSVGYATDGTPVDCVRLSHLGLIDEFQPEIVVSGINHGLNLGDDITYSGTVAAAFEALLLGLPGIAVSQQSQARELDFRLGRTFDFELGAAFAAGVVGELSS